MKYMNYFINTMTITSQHLLSINYNLSTYVLQSFLTKKKQEMYNKNNVYLSSDNSGYSIRYIRNR